MTSTRPLALICAVCWPEFAEPGSRKCAHCSPSRLEPHTPPLVEADHRRRVMSVPAWRWDGNKDAS
jgi:hypothetical protein